MNIQLKKTQLFILNQLKVMIKLPTAPPTLKRKVIDGLTIDPISNETQAYIDFKMDKFEAP